MGVKAICWDWNGTLLDDVTRCLRTMNETLLAFGQPRIADTDSYRSLFRFPIEDFYADVGIGPSCYRAAVDHYLALLAADRSAVALQDGARETIAHLHSQGIRQVLASATQSRLLDAQLRPHGLRDAFEQVLGISDAHAASKWDVIVDWLTETGLDAGDVLFVGDTNHDYEIAAGLGARFVHFAGGHQSLSCDVPVERITALSQLAAHLHD